MAPEQGFDIQHWLDDSAIARERYVAYWSDADREAEKQWDVLANGFEPMERYLAETGLVEDIRACVETMRSRLGRSLDGAGIDLGAGTLWAAPLLMGAGDVDKLYCVEYSRHRLLTLGPVVLDHYGVDPAKIVLALGSFYDIRLEDASLDFVFMSTSFHHADDPLRLLAEIRRVLSPDGVAILVGEHMVGAVGAWARWAAKGAATRLPARLQQAILGRTLVPNRRIVGLTRSVSSDPVLGDHYYTTGQYMSLFRQGGFDAVRVRRPGSPLQSFLLVPHGA